MFILLKSIKNKINNKFHSKPAKTAFKIKELILTNFYWITIHIPPKAHSRKITTLRKKGKRKLLLNFFKNKTLTMRWILTKNLAKGTLKLLEMQHKTKQRIFKWKLINCNTSSEYYFFLFFVASLQVKSNYTCRSFYGSTI